MVGMESKRPASRVDSLERPDQYVTKRGRKVFGGGGIDPDISVAARRPSRYVQNLERRRLFFDFVIDYTSSDSIGRQFIKTDKTMLNSFKEFVRLANEKDEYDQGKDHLTALRDIVDEMGWREADPLLTELELVFERERGEGFTEGLEPEIQLGLERELALRFGGRKAQQRLDLENDSQLEEAIAVLTDIKIYNETLAKSD